MHEDEVATADPETKSQIHNDDAARAVEDVLYYRPVAGASTAARFFFAEKCIHQAFIDAEKWRGADAAIRTYPICDRCGTGHFNDAHCPYPAATPNPPVWGDVLEDARSRIAAKALAAAIRPTYTYWHQCFNCKEQVGFTIPKGEPALAYIAGAPCPTCACSPVQGIFTFMHGPSDRKARPWGWWRR